jgi:hypothetical protein
MLEIEKVANVALKILLHFTSSSGCQVGFSSLPEIKTEPRYRYGIEEKLQDALATRLQ